MFVLYSIYISMNLSTLLEQKRKGILKRWYSCIMESYPTDVSSFLISEKDRFANPVGYTILSGIETLFDEVTHGTNHDRVINALDSIIRIRAVQDFTPSQAIAFVSLLKTAVRVELKLDDASEMFEELLQFDTRIDDLASLASDIYVKCRDDINRIKVGKANAERATAMRLNKVKHK
jgi:hypothetical protein